jgi:hypothetical protein
MLVIEKTCISKITEFILSLVDIEDFFSVQYRKKNGIFLTRDISIINSVLQCLENNESLFSKRILEPSCGQGIFLLVIILKAYLIKPCSESISKFIEENLFFADIDPNMVIATEYNISKFYEFLFQEQYLGYFNSFSLDFTLKNQLSSKHEYSKLYQYYNKFDYVIGNPPYITLYGRRDKKKSENQRIYYLENYHQFPASVKNGKINYVMLFVEHGVEFLKENGIISYLVDVSFFETAYKYCRKYLLENTSIHHLIYNIKSFDSVASGQIIITAEKQRVDSHRVITLDLEQDIKYYVNQADWYKEEDEYKFRINSCFFSNSILDKIFQKRDPRLKDLYPKKNLRTCTMLLDMEDKFTMDKELNTSHITIYPYYQGAKSVKYKYSKPIYCQYFLYDKILQDKINEELKAELTKQGIKNKKRIGLGEMIIYDNPKIYIRQSAKEIIATYDERPSAANNSLYVFSLRNNSQSSVYFLKYLCGFLNSKLCTFFAQQRRIIRYNKGKQPQIKTSDLYEINVPTNIELQNKISTLVDRIYYQPAYIDKITLEIDMLLYDYYELTNTEIKFLEESIESFLE